MELLIIDLFFYWGKFDFCDPFIGMVNVLYCVICLGEKYVIGLALASRRAGRIDHAQAVFLGSFSIIGSRRNGNRRAVHGRGLVLRTVHTRLDPVTDGHDLGVECAICTDGRICMDGLGHHEGACSCCTGLVGSAITAQYHVVLYVFWLAPYRFVNGHCQPVVCRGCHRD